MSLSIQQQKIDRIIGQVSARSIDLLWDESRTIFDDKERDEFVGALIGTLVAKRVRQKYQRAEISK